MGRIIFRILQCGKFFSTRSISLHNDLKIKPYSSLEVDAEESTRAVNIQDLGIFQWEGSLRFEAQRFVEIEDTFPWETCCAAKFVDDIRRYNCRTASKSSFFFINTSLHNSKKTKKIQKNTFLTLAFFTFL